MLQRTVPILILGLTGAVLVVAYFIPPLKGWGEAVVDWFNILAAVAFILGAGNLLAVNLEKISSRRPGWAYAAITLVSFAAMLVFGLAKTGAVPNPAYPDVHLAGEYETTQSPFGWMYEYVLAPLTATMFGLLAFYVASAAFRAKRSCPTCGARSRSFARKCDPTVARRCARAWARRRRPRRATPTAGGEEMDEGEDAAPEDQLPDVGTLRKLVTATEE